MLQVWKLIFGLNRILKKTHAVVSRLFPNGHLLGGKSNSTSFRLDESNLEDDELALIVDAEGPLQRISSVTTEESRGEGVL